MTKWVANIWWGKLYVAEIEVVERPKTWKVVDTEKNEEARDYDVIFYRYPPELFDTREAALSNLIGKLFFKKEDILADLRIAINEIDLVANELGI